MSSPLPHLYYAWFFIFAFHSQSRAAAESPAQQVPFCVQPSTSHPSEHLHQVLQHVRRMLEGFQMADLPSLISEVERPEIEEVLLRLHVLGMS